MKSIEHAFYTSAAWEKARKAYIQSVNGLCERCLAKGLITSGKIVHHKEHLTEENYKKPEIAFNFDNFELLCQKCHNEEHHQRKGKRYKFSDDGAMILL